MIGVYRALRTNGVLGINERNIRYINACNPRRLFKLVNDKTETKRIALAADIPTPELYGIIENARDMRRLGEFTRHPDGFVVKPANGSQGKGIVVVDSPLNDGWRLSSGRRIATDELKYHINNIVSGMHSLGGQPDKAIIEYRVKFDDVFSRISFKGVPDIRVIVFRGLPIFGMIRLPTSESDGKANLHRGGVGVGLDIVSGVTLMGMQHDALIDLHPDTLNPLSDIQVPYWEEILHMAARSYDVTGMGYIGVDVVLDRDKGPLLLEMNARPGISIQIANRVGMRFHLEAASAASIEKLDAAGRVRLAKSLVETQRSRGRKPAPTPTTVQSVTQ